MATIRWQGKEFACGNGETVLDRLLRAGVPVAHSCRVGACQTCVLRACRGRPPVAAQKGLKETWQVQGYFLACRCVPDEDLEIAAGEVLPEVGVTVRQSERVTPDILRLWLEPTSPFEYRAGQFAHLVRGDGLARPYSLASVPGSDRWLELHVRKMPGGAMSSYLYDNAQVGTGLALRGPSGDCFYTEGRPDQPLLLAGTGTGLAPLLGIAKDALARSHRGPIELHHGALVMQGLYAHAELRAMAERHDNFTYSPCVLRGPVPPDVDTGPLQARVLARATARKDSRVFLCGPPEFVQDVQRQVFLAGVALSNIHADAFVTAPPPG